MGLFTTNPVFDMLKQDHRKVEELFQQFESAKDSRSKARIIQETLRELDVHARLEETLIYPAIREHINEEDIMDEALEEHHVAHVLINELKRMKASDARYEAKFTVLGESIKHHVKEEEGTMFPEAEHAEINWDELSQKAMKQKAALLKRGTAKGSRSRKQSSGSRSRSRRTATRTRRRKSSSRHLKKAA